MTLALILIATLAGGLLSVGAAALLTFGALHRWLPRMLAFAVGTLLGVAFLDLLPHASEGGLEAHTLFATVLAGIVGFFILEKLALWRHAHPDGADAPLAAQRHPAGAMILIGDGVHNFCDGILVAAAFLVDPWLGLTTAAAVVAHEIPQEVGDFLVLVESGYTRREALGWNAVASLASVVGGIVGYLALSQAQGAIPHALAISAASFIYIAVADLVPMLHRTAEVRVAATQVAMMLAGIGIVFVHGELLHH